MRSRLYRPLVLFATVVSLAVVVENGTRISGQGNSNVPAPPTERADRFGVYNWGVDYEAYPANATIDRLNWAADKVAELGSRTIRVAMPGDIYGVGRMADDLALAAASPAYDKLFTDPRFKTYLLTCVSSTEVISPWSDGYKQSEYNAVRDEVARLGDYLLGNPKFAGKTFIILNWEGDGGMFPFNTKQSIWDAYTAWIQSRADGVKLARGRNPNSQARLFSGFEFNLVKGLKGLPCGTPVDDPIRKNPLENRCTLDYVAPRVDVDYYSYSSWQTMDVKFQGPNPSYKNAYKTDLTFAMNLIRQRRPEITEANFIIGEWGIHRTRWGETTVGNFFNEMLDAFDGPDAFKVSYAIFWQIIDNAPFVGSGEDGYGLFRSRNGVFNITRAGETFRRRLAGQSVERWTGGPSINRGSGVVDAATGRPEFRPDSLLRLDALGPETPFSANGNRVSIEQGINQFIMPRDNAAAFSESETRITASLPPGLRPGLAFIYVTDGNGVESQSQGVNFICDDCPFVSNVIDEKQINEFFPGVIATISGGRFSESGNTIIIEQQSEQRARYRFVVPPANILQESPSQIKVRLPRDLIISRYTAVSMADTNRRESNQFGIRVDEERVSGPPVIRVSGVVVNRDNGSSSSPPGGVVTISGARFSAGGNTVIIEQGGERYVVAKDANWSESAGQINLTLPASLKPGRAQIYVIDAQGRESRIAEITIPRGLAPARPPIRR
jgi:hypothetical protein